MACVSYTCGLFIRLEIYCKINENQLKLNKVLLVHVQFQGLCPVNDKATKRIFSVKIHGKEC